MFRYTYIARVVATRVTWNACFIGPKRVFGTFAFAYWRDWEVTTTLSYGAVYEWNSSPFGRGMPLASDVIVPMVLHGASNLTRERRDTSPVDRLTHCFHDVIVCRSSWAFHWLTLTASCLDLLYVHMQTCRHGANRVFMHAFRKIMHFFGVDAKQMNPNWPVKQDKMWNCCSVQ